MKEVNYREKIAKHFHKIWYEIGNELVQHYDSLSVEGKDFYRKKADEILHIQLSEGKVCDMCDGTKESPIRGGLSGEFGYSCPNNRSGFGYSFPTHFRGIDSDGS